MSFKQQCGEVRRRATTDDGGCNLYAAVLSRCFGQCGLQSNHSNQYRLWKQSHYTTTETKGGRIRVRSSYPPCRENRVNMHGELNHPPHCAARRRRSICSQCHLKVPCRARLSSHFGRTSNTRPFRALDNTPPRSGHARCSPPRGSILMRTAAQVQMSK